MESVREMNLEKDTVPEVLDISIKGKRKKVSSYQIGGVTIKEQGIIVRIADIFDEYWLDRDILPNPEKVIAELRQKTHKPDLFTFAQRVPEVEPMYSFHLEWENVAALPISTYDNWFKNQISSATRRNIRASEKKGVTVHVAEYNEDYVQGIMSIYNESPTRHGKNYWHYGKDFETVRRENGTYAQRSTFLAAYFKNEMVGYLKIVWDKHTGAIMQILSKMAVWDNRPNNALLAEAVRQCCLRGVKYLLYEKYTYGKKNEDSLTKFKQNNGFVRMDIPRYYVSLTYKGSLALRFGLHKDMKERLPEWILAPARDLRGWWYKKRLFLTAESREKKAVLRH